VKGPWEERRLGGVAEFVMGQAPPGDASNFDGKGTPFVKAGEFGAERPTIKEWTTKPLKMGRRGDVFICVVGATAGKLNLGEDCAIGRSVAAIRPSPHIDQRFLWCQLIPMVESIRGKSTGAAQGVIGKELLQSISLRLPPLPEQRRIVAILDEAFEGIAKARANAEKNIENARALFEGYVATVFAKARSGWQTSTLSDVSTISYGYTESASADNVGPKFLRITDIQDGQVDWSTVPYCPISSERLSRYRLADGDIVFARTGATTGKSFLISNPPDAVFASYLIRLQLRGSDLLPAFVFLFFQSTKYWESIRAGVTGSAQGGFNATKLGALTVPHPRNVAEQRAVVVAANRVRDEVSQAEAIYWQKLDALDELKKSLLHHAFAGEL
jgi:type I restriction enzyme S subunit